MTTKHHVAGDPIRSVFIVLGEDLGWIIERLMHDIAGALRQRDIAVRIGNASEYAGEEVVFNARYLAPFRDARARVNALFVTHIDDRIREAELRRTFGKFDSYVCMSPHEADFVAGLKGDPAGVAGIELPPRDLSVRPVRLGLFSACYPDGRKNEDWITAYFDQRPPAHRNSFTFCLMGADWEGFCGKLAARDLNFELYRYARALPGEYQLYKEILPGLDALIYLGFDGGAMSAYDAASAGIDLILTNVSYHRGVDQNSDMLDGREDFFAALDRLHGQVAARSAMLTARSVDAYAGRLLVHWNALAGVEQANVGTLTSEVTADSSVVSEFRNHYKPLGFSRIRSALIRLLLVTFKRH